MMPRFQNAIIDGNYLLWRSFYAHRTLSARVGAQKVGTGMAYGFLQTLCLLSQHYPCRYYHVAWDSPKSRRKKIYKRYKEDRAKKKAEDKALMEEFGVQLKIVNDVLEHVPVTQYRCVGEEADDIVATLTKECEGSKLIVGSDHDLFQLLAKDVRMLLLRPQLEVIMTRKKFAEERGIPASKYWQVLALTGDSGDGIPGLVGVGEKTAVRALNEFPTLVKDLLKGEVTDGAEHFLTRRGRTLDDAINTVKLSRQLTKLNKKVPVDVPQTRPKGNLDRFFDSLMKYQFESMMSGVRRKYLQRLFR